MTRKKQFTIAGILMLIGAVLALAALVPKGFDLRKFSSAEYVDSTIPVTGAFSAIDFDVMDCDVKILPSPDGQTKLVTHTAADVPVTAQVADKTLVVKQTDERNWTEHFGVMWFDNVSATLYIDQSDFNSLAVRTVSGDIHIETGTFHISGSVELNSTSGDIRWLTGADADSVQIKTVSGDVTLKNIRSDSFLTLSTTSGEVVLENSDASGALSVQTVSGDMKLEGNDAGTAYFKTTSGDIRVNKANISDGGAELITTSGELKLEELVTDGTLQIKTSSGDVHFERSQAARYAITTTSGDVTGTLVSKEFHFKVNTRGSTSSDGRNGEPVYEINTSSGDVDLEFVP